MAHKSARKPDCPLSVLAGPYFDGALGDAEARRYENHLFGCPTCRAELRAVRRLSQLIRSCGFPGPWASGPEDVPVEEPIAEEAERPDLVPRPSPSLALAAALPVQGGGPGGRR